MRYRAVFFLLFYTEPHPTRLLFIVTTLEVIFHLYWSSIILYECDTFRCQFYKDLIIINILVEEVRYIASILKFCFREII
jgi:hypothetical protein